MDSLHPSFRVVGAVDSLGYLYCAECRNPDTFNLDQQVWGDSEPCASEPCDGCGRVVSSVPRFNHYARAAA